MNNIEIQSAGFLYQPRRNREWKRYTSKKTTLFEAMSDLLNKRKANDVDHEVYVVLPDGTKKTIVVEILHELGYRRGEVYVIFEFDGYQIDRTGHRLKTKHSWQWQAK